jgi:hypothetical protein
LRLVNFSMQLQNSVNLLRRIVPLIVDKKDKLLNNKSAYVEVGQNIVI